MTITKWIVISSIKHVCFGNNWRVITFLACWYIEGIALDLQDCTQNFIVVLEELFFFRQSLSLGTTL